MKTKQEYLLGCAIAGFTYYRGVTMLGDLKPGTTLKLKRDKNNKYDPQAVMIKCNGEKIGYIPKRDNAIIYKLLKVGYKGLTCIMQRVKPDAHTEEMVQVAVFLTGGPLARKESAPITAHPGQ